MISLSDRLVLFTYSASPTVISIAYANRVTGGKQREQQRSGAGKLVAAQTKRLELADRTTRAFPLAVELPELHQLPRIQRCGRRRRQLCRPVGRRRAQARFPVQETRGHRDRASEVQRRRPARDRTHGKHRCHVTSIVVTAGSDLLCVR